MDCRTRSAHKFTTRLEFKQYDFTLTKEQSLLTETMSSCEGKNIKTQYNVLGYRIDLHFHDYMLAIETDENGHSYRNIDYEIKRQKTIEQEFCCTFIRIDPEKENFDILKAINEIFRQIKQSGKKTLISKTSARLLRLEIKSVNMIKLKAMKIIVENYFLIISNNGNALRQL